MSGTVERLYGRMMSIVGIARLTASQAMGGKGVRRYQARFDGDEIRDGTPALQQYGVASRAKVGADALVVFLGGNRSSGIIIAVNDRRFQLELEEGEVALHDDTGQKVHLTRAGLVLDGGGKPVTIQNAPKVTADTPELHCTGRITADGDVTAGTVSLQQHQHRGVQSGGGQSGPPVT
ncbi:phage baseplate assembly protein [Pararoseomonas sp. SCSIO 73927]|uniref:phage baseplate assembly protein domain-containing protein n=1 Tax=Pararoseomonas sp. SCSIO 73927 TaxID=3114537 RepID=UPI0030CE13AF